MRSLAGRDDMGMWVGRGRKARVAYGFDDIALVPGALTVNPNEVDISWELCGHRYQMPIIAAAMDGVVGPPGRGDEDHPVHLQRAHQGRADPPAHSRDQEGRRPRRRLLDPAACRAV